jgi:hypothetical protein
MVGVGLKMEDTLRNGARDHAGSGHARLGQEAWTGTGEETTAFFYLLLRNSGESMKLT